MRILFLLTALLMAACQSLPPLPEWQSPEGLDHPELGHIIDLRSGQRVSSEALVDRLAREDRVLIGERHDNPDHHSLELWMLKALAERRQQGSVLLEMIEPSQQQRVTDIQGQMMQGQRLDDLPGALGWGKGWPWALYGELVAYSLAQPAPLLHANLDRDEITAIYRDPPPLTGAPADQRVQAQLLDQIRESHCNMLPESQLPAMLAVQQQRDRRMATRLATAPEPALLFAGGFHVRRDLGVPLHLSDRGSPAAVVLMLAEVGEVVSAEQGDYVWFTPAQPQQDHCAQFQRPAR
jgi:uncharacterized iron-regulated protein